MMNFFWGSGPFAVRILLPLALVAAGAIYWIAASRNKAGRSRRLRGSTLENRILKLAVQKGGVLTITDIAAQTGLSIREAEKAMAKMVDFSRVSMKVGDEGLVTYEFLEILNGASGRKDLPGSTNKGL